MGFVCLCAAVNVLVQTNAIIAINWDLWCWASVRWASGLVSSLTLYLAGFAKKRKLRAECENTTNTNYSAICTNVRGSVMLLLLFECLRNADVKNMECQ